MKTSDFKVAYNATPTEVKAFEMGLAEGSKRGIITRNKLQYDVSNDKKHHKEAIAAIELAQLLINGGTPSKVCVGVDPNGGETDQTDEIMIDSKFLALIILKGLNLNIKVESHLANVRFNEDTFSSCWIEFPNKVK